MLETIFQYSLLSFFLSIVLILVALVRFQIKPWQLWLIAVGLTYPGAVIADHFGAQLLLLFLLALGILIVPSVRLLLFTKPLYKLMRKSLPPIGLTESIALEAGSVWWDAELFQGNPDWTKLSELEATELTDEEQSFVDNEVETLCGMVDSYKIVSSEDLPKEVWQYIFDKGFLGLIIPKEFNGLGFSHFAHAIIVGRLSSASQFLGISVMVPNSLGPGELLLKYGTEEQKQHYLPRLAKGKEAQSLNTAHLIKQCGLAKKMIFEFQKMDVVSKKSVGKKEFFRTYRLGSMKRNIIITPESRKNGVYSTMYI